MSRETKDCGESEALAYGGTPITVEQLEKLMDSKTKPLGSLGALEPLAIRIGVALQTTCPRLVCPTILVFAADHGIAAEGVSAYPSEVTVQMVGNFLAGGAAINVLARQHGLRLEIVDAGLARALEPRPNLTDRAVARSTRNSLREPAMTRAQCEQALRAGREIASAAIGEGANVLLLGEMGIGNTATTALLLHRLTNWPLAACVGRGTGLNEAGLQHKRGVLEAASARIPRSLTPLEMLEEFGGFEIAMLTGAIIEATRHRCITVIDGFTVSVAAYLAAELEKPSQLFERCIFSHCSAEDAHRALLTHLNVQPLLNLGLRLGEGSGAALAWPLIDSAARLLTEMASFASAGVATRLEA